MPDRLVRLDDVLQAICTLREGFEFNGPIPRSELEAALVALPEAPQWQPIATAPKDGTQVLVWDGARVNCGKWDQWSPDNGWWIACVHGAEANWSDNGGGEPVLHPTHWMPLPDPPGQAQKGAAA